MGHRARGLRRQRRDGARRQPRPLHPDTRRCRTRCSGTTRPAPVGDRADGVVVTPSHNPPRDGGFKYNPPDGGPAGSDITGWVQQRANDILRGGLRDVRRQPLAQARAADTTSTYDFLGTYVDDLPSAIDIDAIRAAGVRIGADPLGGASVDYWGEIADRHKLDLTVVNPLVDPTWRFMTLDWDGKIRMDCSSPDAMASLIGRRSEFQIATGNDADADRHGIVTPDAGLLNPNHYLAVAIDYLFSRRDGWPADAAVGKTLVSSSMIDRVAASLGRRLVEVPVGFKWFVPGTARRIDRLRRGGVGGCVVPAPRRPGVDDRQGRPAAVPAGLGDPRGDGILAERALSRADRALRRSFVRTRRRTGDPRGEGGARRAVPRPGDGHRARR